MVILTLFTGLFSTEMKFWEGLGTRLVQSFFGQVYYRCASMTFRTLYYLVMHTVVVSEYDMGLGALILSDVSMLVNITIALK